VFTSGQKMFVYTTVETVVAVDASNANMRDVVSVTGASDVDRAPRDRVESGASSSLTSSPNCD